MTLTIFSPSAKVYAVCACAAFLSASAVSLSARPPSSAAVPAARVMSVEDSVFYALRNNQQIRVANEEVEIARAKIRETRALGFPKIDFNLNTSRYESEGPLVLTDHLGSIFYDAHRRPSENHTARFTMAQYIYAGGRYTSNMRLARTNLRVAETTREILASSVRAEVKKSFYRLVHASARLEEMRKEYARLAGSAHAPDKDIIPSLRRDILSAENDYASARLTFLSAAGLELNTDFEASGTLEKTPPAGLDADKLVAQAYQYRRELSKVAIQETIDSLGVSLLQTEKFPAVTLGGVYELMDVNRSDSRKNWAMYLNFNLPVFDGWASWARLDARKSHARQSGIKKTLVEDSIAYEVRMAVLACQTAARRVAYDEELLAALLESRTVNPRAVHLARISLLNSRLAAQVGAVNLELAVGKEIS